MGSSCSPCLDRGLTSAVGSNTRHTPSAASIAVSPRASAGSAAERHPVVELTHRDCCGRIWNRCVRGPSEPPAHHAGRGVVRSGPLASGQALRRKKSSHRGRKVPGRGVARGSRATSASPVRSRCGFVWVSRMAASSPSHSATAARPWASVSGLRPVGRWASDAIRWTQPDSSQRLPSRCSRSPKSPLQL
jgi:hypothetical protein